MQASRKYTGIRDYEGGERTRERWVGRFFLVFFMVLGQGTWEGATAAETRSGTPFVLALQNDSLSVAIEQVPLGDVLVELARQVGLEVYITKSDAQQKISAKFNSLPLKEGIQRILQGKSYALITAPTPPTSENRGAQRIEKIRVLSQGEAYVKLTGHQDTTTAPSENAPGEGTPKSEDEQISNEQQIYMALQQKPFTELQREALEADEPAMRVAALRILAGRQEEGTVLPTIVSALQDKDLSVRATAIQTLEEVEEGALPFDTIAELARTDPSPPLRVHAFQVLAEKGMDAALEHLQRGLHDSDPYVREQVGRLLEDMGQKPDKAATNSIIPRK